MGMPGHVGRSAPDAVAVDGGAVWVGFHREAYVVRIDPTTNQAVARVSTPARECGITAGEGFLWAAHCAPPGEPTIGLSRIDPATNASSGPVVRASTWSPTVGAGSVWVVARPGDDAAVRELWRIDPATNATTAKVPVASGALPTAFAFGSVWVGHIEGDRGVSRIDAGTNTVAARIATGPSPVVAIAGGESAVWVLPAEEARIYRIDPGSSATTSHALPAAPGAGWANRSLAVGGGSVWARTGERRIARLNPATGNVLGTFTAPMQVGGLAYGFGSLWATVPELNEVWRITPR